MLVGVLSDTHDNLPAIRAAKDLFADQHVVAMLHAGDYVAPFALKLLMEGGLPFLGVLGNNDGEREGLRRLCATLYAPPHVIELGGRTIALTHDLRDLHDTAMKGADLCVFGHTHKPEIRRGSPIMLNPGEAGGWLGGRCTVALVDLDTMAIKIVDVDTKEVWLQ